MSSRRTRRMEARSLSSLSARFFRNTSACLRRRWGSKRRRWGSNPSGKCSYERPTRGTLCGTMRSMRGADAGCLAINYQSLSAWLIDSGFKNQAGPPNHRDNKVDLDQDKEMDGAGVTKQSSTTGQRRLWSTAGRSMESRRAALQFAGELIRSLSGITP